jgi:AP-3 complex subunit mu
VEAAGVLSVLQRIVVVLQDYLTTSTTPLTPELVAANLDTVLELLCELVDNGQLLTTEPNALHEVVLPPSLLTKLMTATGLQSRFEQASGQGMSIPHAPWRRAKIKYTSNEIFVDLVECVSGIVDAAGKTVASQVSCALHCETKLSGVPDVTLVLKPAQAIALPTFHRCVRVDRFLDQQGTFCFIPPDGTIELATWTSTLPETGSSPLPFAVQFAKGRSPSEAFDVILSTRAAAIGFPADLAVRIPLPQSTCKNVRLSASQGETSVLRDEAAGTVTATWSLGPLKKGASRITLTCSNIVVGEGQEAMSQAAHAIVSCSMTGTPLTGIKVDSLKMARVGDWKPYKGVKYATKVQDLVFRA